MAQMGRPGLSAAQKSELWQRWKQGQSLSEIGRALGKHAGSIHGVVSSNGGFIPPHRRRFRWALTLAEREEISRGLATAIEPLRLTSGRGIAPNAPSVVGSRHSHRSSDLSRANCSWIGRPNKLQVGSSGNFPRKRLCGFPTKPSTGVCLFEPGGVLKKEPMGHLRSRRRMRRAQSASTASQPRGQIVDGVSIRDRPDDVEDRAIPGHWKGDLITAAQNTHLATLVERWSRFTMLVKVPGKDTIGVVTALSAQIQHDLPLISWTPGYATAALASYSAGE